MDALVIAALVIWFLGLGGAYAWAREYPKKELAGRVLLWPVFLAIWCFGGVVTGIKLIPREIEKTEESVEGFDDEER
jgi:hypothetical protein